MKNPGVEARVLRRRGRGRVEEDEECERKPVQEISLDDDGLSLDGSDSDIDPSCICGAELIKIDKVSDVFGTNHGIKCAACEENVNNSDPVWHCISISTSVHKSEILFNRITNICRCNIFR